MLNPSKSRVRTPIFPDYTSVKYMIRIWEGVSRKDVRGMINTIHEQTGTPQNPVDWTTPDTWIPERLDGATKELAMRIWVESKKHVNPRHCYGCYLLINLYELLQTDEEGTYFISDNGKGFLRNDPNIVRDLDQQEGILYLLEMMSTMPSVKRGDIIDEWGDYLNKYSNYGTVSTTADSLRRRLMNLVERKLVVRMGNSYSISDKGKQYINAIIPREENPKNDIQKLIKTFNEAQRTLLKEALYNMPPAKFEELVGDLLDRMDYHDVEVTKVSGDKGVDVVGKVQFGITTVTEVVQVKRHQANISRPVLDQLRGCLPYHNAIRGTLITTSDFTKGCKEAALFPNAAPITLINGDVLIDMLLKYEIGISKNTLVLEEFDDTFFKVFQDQEENI